MRAPPGEHAGAFCAEESPRALPFLQPPFQKGHMLLHATCPCTWWSIRVWNARMQGASRAGVTVQVCLESPHTRPSTPPVFYGLCLFLAFRPVPPTPPYCTLNHHLSAPRSRRQRATVLTADRCVRTGFVGGATEAGFLGCYAGSSPLRHTAASPTVLPPLARQAV